jgi:hypothetical protein
VATVGGIEYDRANGDEIVGFELCSRAVHGDSRSLQSPGKRGEWGMLNVLNNHAVELKLGIPASWVAESLQSFKSFELGSRVEESREGV